MQQRILNICKHIPPVEVLHRSSATAAAAPAHELSQLGVDNLLGLGKHEHQVSHLRHVPGGEVRVGGARVALPPDRPREDSYFLGQPSWLHAG